jgi:glycosyltransferase involved in cell wall biosynthesis
MSRPVRIAVVTYNLPRAGHKRGGVDRVAHELSEGLAARGHLVTVFSHDPAPPGASYTVRTLPWAWFTGTRLGRSMTMGYLGNVLSLLPPFGEAEVIISHGDSLLLPALRRPVIRVMHGSAIDEARAATALHRRVLQRGVHVLELLTSMTQLSVGVSAATQRSNRWVNRVIHNGVDLSVFHEDAAARDRTPGIVFVGAMGGRKRGAWLVKQFVERIRPVLPSATLHMVCEGGGRVDGVEFYNGLDDRALAALYRRAWVYASPSTYEGFGLPYIEAMACGTPVVATTNPGSIEILANGTYGRLVSDEQFADSLLDLLQSHGARETLRDAGRTRAAQFDLRRTIDEYERLVFSLANGHG